MRKHFLPFFFFLLLNSFTNAQDTIPEHKLSIPVLDETSKDRVYAAPGILRVAIGLTDNNSESLKTLNSLGFKFTDSLGSILTGEIDTSHILELAKQASVQWIDAVAPEAVPLNDKLRSGQRITYLQSGLTYPGLYGNGVTIGVGDGGELGQHIDFGDRVTNLANGAYSSFGQHQDHVSGIIGSAGNLNPLFRGIVPEADILTQKTTLINYNISQYYQQYGMVLTNNSYGSSFNCATNGTYNYTSYVHDEFMIDYPEVLIVFAAGNSGGSTCTGYPQGYKTVLKYYQSAKNILTVGNVGKDRIISNSSSRGPTKDGRIKPEILGIGTGVLSTGNNNNYFSASGTSMASPAVVGTLALMIERYRQLNNNQNPKSGLMKAIACNTADDLGTRHPDYIHGFGMINARRAVEAINDGLYASDQLTDGEEKYFNVSTENGDEQLKVLLYWNDVPADPTAVTTLVNNLDLQVITPSGAIIYPWVLNDDPAHVADIATRGEDQINNIEQVTIDMPEPGTYSIIVTGTDVPEGPQDFFLSYDVIAPEIVITHPAGNEVFEKGQEITIEWDASVLNTEDFIIEYTLNGSLWIPLGMANADQRQFFFQLPTSLSTSAKIWIRTVSQATTSETFSILGSSTILSLEDQCDGEVEIFWSEADGALEYTLYQFDGNEMNPIAVTSNPSIQVLADMDQKHWFSVAPVYTGNYEGVRSLAESLTVECLTNGLPVELSDFSGRIDGAKNTIHWLTIMEENTSAFILERSEDARNWEVVDTVEASGWSYVPRTYDADDYFWFNKTYYRLKIIDFDGAFEYSEIISIKRSEQLKFEDGITLFPVPATDQVTVRWNPNDSYTKGEINVFDNFKRRMMHVPANPDQSAQKLDLSKLLPGIYTVQKGFYIEKLVITKVY